MTQNFLRKPDIYNFISYRLNLKIKLSLLCKLGKLGICLIRNSVIVLFILWFGVTIETKLRTLQKYHFTLPLSFQFFFKVG